MALKTNQLAILALAFAAPVAGQVPTAAQVDSLKTGTLPAQLLLVREFARTAEADNPCDTELWFSRLSILDRPGLWEVGFTQPDDWAWTLYDDTATPLEALGVYSSIFLEVREAPAQYEELQALLEAHHRDTGEVDVSAATVFRIAGRCR